MSDKTIDEIIGFVKKSQKEYPDNNAYELILSYLESKSARLTDEEIKVEAKILKDPIIPIERQSGFFFYCEHDGVKQTETGPELFECNLMLNHKGKHQYIENEVVKHEWE